MKTNSVFTGYYENIEFNLSTGQTDYDLDAQQPTFLAVFGTSNLGPDHTYPTSVEIRTNNTISAKLNSTTAHAVTITSTDSPYRIEGVEINNMYFTNNSGSTAAIKLFLQDSKY